MKMGIALALSTVLSSIPALAAAESPEVWTPTCTVGAPIGRASSSAVWTGGTGDPRTADRLIVWGGLDAQIQIRDDGGIYHPGTDTWRTTGTDGAPLARYNHTAVWTGNTGNPATANRMIVWGGYNKAPENFLGDGAIYDPATDTWEPMATAGAPSEREKHSAVWTGETGDPETSNRMIVWGGYGELDGPAAGVTETAYGELNSGAMYDPATDSWEPIGGLLATLAGVERRGILGPSPRYLHTAVWTGDTGHPETSNRMIVWGGLQSGPGRLNTGGIYDPASDRWTLTSTEGAPGRRDTHTAVWTGKRMIVWGGKQSIFHTDRLATGGMYDPAADTWTPTATAGVPAGREEHSAVWTGKRMIVWGGRTVEGKFSNDGALFDPVANAWEPMPMEGAPTVRATHPAVWTGKWMLVWSGWGGVPGGGRPNTGALFGPAPDWTADPCGSPS